MLSKQKLNTNLFLQDSTEFIFYYILKNNMFISNLISATCFKNPKSTKDCLKKTTTTTPHSWLSVSQLMRLNCHGCSILKYKEKSNPSIYYQSIFQCQHLWLCALCALRQRMLPSKQAFYFLSGKALLIFSKPHSAENINSCLHDDKFLFFS